MKTARARKLEPEDGPGTSPAPVEGRAGAIAMFGAGAAADVWAPALRSIEGVRLERVSLADLSAAIERPELDAFCFTEASAELVGAVRRGLLARKHVLIAAPVALPSTHLRDIEGLALRRDSIAMFDTPDLADENVAFIHRMIGGDGKQRVSAMWRARYARAVRTGHGLMTLPEAAIGEIAAMSALLGAPPSRVSALSPAPDDQTGSAGAVMLALMFESGLVARIDVSFIEPEARRHVVVACADRTVIMQDEGQGTTMRMVSGPSDASRSPWAEAVVESPRGAQPAHASAVASRFVTSVRSRDRRANNGGALAAASLAWDAARASMSRDGEPVDVSVAERALPSRPNLQLIRGGGRRSSDASAPDLTLVARSEPPPRSA